MENEYLDIYTKARMHAPWPMHVRTAHAPKHAYMRQGTYARDKARTHAPRQMTYTI